KIAFPKGKVAKPEVLTDEGLTSNAERIYSKHFSPSVFFGKAEKSTSLVRGRLNRWFYIKNGRTKDAPV
ncbi:MAG: hypothetical protein IKZ06_00550, partial [Oscillospiraceae bacterium]|nr:hypothetical protein [Oscillospiraceae bacterium]